MERSIDRRRFMSRSFMMLALVPSAILASASATAQPTTNDAVVRLFEQQIEADWFAAPFLAQVPIEQIEAIAESLTSQFGPFVLVEGEGGQLTTRFGRATMPTQITLDGNGRIAGLFFGRRCQSEAISKTLSLISPRCLVDIGSGSHKRLGRCGASG